MRITDNDLFYSDSVLFSIIHSWAEECDTAIAYKVSRKNKRIKVYTLNPDRLIGKGGEKVKEKTKLLNDIQGYEDFRFQIHDIECIFISQSISNKYKT